MIILFEPRERFRCIRHFRRMPDFRILWREDMIYGRCEISARYQLKRYRWRVVTIRAAINAAAAMKYLFI